MAYINLLPWREEAQKAREQQFYTILGTVALCCFGIMFAIGQLYQARIDGQVYRNNFLKKEIQLLDERIKEIQSLDDKKKELETRIRVIEQLQRSRNLGTEVIDELAKVVPSGIYLTAIEKERNQIQLQGKSESNNHLANMIRKIEASTLFTDPILESITSNDAKSKLLSDFSMRLKIKGIIVKTDKAKGGKK